MRISHYWIVLWLSCCLLLFEVRLIVKSDDGIQRESEQTVFGDSSPIIEESFVEDESTPPDNSDLVVQVSAIIESRFDNMIHVYYNGEESSSPMGTIAPMGQLSLNTFSGHQFFATFGGPDEDRVSWLTISKSEDYYTFVPKDLALFQLDIERRSEPNPHVKYLEDGLSRSVHARFRCMSSRELDLWTDDPSAGEGELEATLRPGEETTFDTYAGLHYSYTPHGNLTVLGSFDANDHQGLYLMIDEEMPATGDLKEVTERELAHHIAYKNDTGLEWRSYFGKDGPRPPPSLFMWPAEEVGQVHKVISRHGTWHCRGSFRDCQNPEVELQLEVISLHPRAFIIKNFLSAFEADAIIEAGAPELADSKIGEDGEGVGEISATRSSKTAWVERSRTIETETVTLRAADLLQIEESLLSNDVSAEDMQVVHYEVGQKYDPHHDWSVDNAPEQRFITLLFYLTDMEDENAGGETSFPKAAEGRGIKVHPGKGSAVLFYSMLEDGNGDDLSLHSSLPVLHGEKWLANYWVWDPKRN